MTADIYVVGNLKGGTSKTTIITMLAYQTAVLRGEKTLVVDMDPQGDASFKLSLTAGITEKFEESVAVGFKERDLRPQIVSIAKNLDLIPSDKRFRTLPRLLLSYFPEDSYSQVTYLKRLLEPLREDYDHIFIDVPPTLSDYSDLTVMAADYGIIAMQMQRRSVDGAHNYVSYMNHMIDEYGAKIKLIGLVPVFTKAEAPSEKKVDEEARELFGGWVLDNVLKHQERIKVYDDQGIQYRKYDSGVVDRWDQITHGNFSDIWDELLKNRAELDERKGD